VEALEQQLLTVSSARTPLLNSKVALGFSPLLAPMEYTPQLLSFTQ